jgi:hypothetical protein
MQKQLQQGGIAVPYGRHSFMEVVEVATGRVWMSVEPATQQDYDLLLKKLDKAFRGVGWATRLWMLHCLDIHPMVRESRYENVTSLGGRLCMWRYRASHLYIPME